VKIDASGKKEAKIEVAEGEAKAITLLAEAKAKKVKVESEAIIKYFKDEAQTFKALETFEKAYKRNTKLVVDPKSNIVNVINDMAGTTITPIGKQKVGA